MSSLDGYIYQQMNKIGVRVEDLAKVTGKLDTIPTEQQVGASLESWHVSFTEARSHMVRVSLSHSLLHVYNQ